LEDFLNKIYGTSKGNYFIRILKGELNKVETDQLFAKLDLQQYKDRRNEYNYAIDLILGWIVENFVIFFCEVENSFELTLVSSDKDREFLPVNEIDAGPDFKLTNEHYNIFIELVQDFTSFWKTNRKCHLKDDKIIRLEEKEGLLLGIDIVSDKFFIESVKLFSFTSMPKWK
jgi:hypothetical protein